MVGFPKFSHIRMYLISELINKKVVSKEKFAEYICIFIKFVKIGIKM